MPLLDEDYLVLSNHPIRPKGQEWSTVFVLNVVDGLPARPISATGTRDEIEEERRLLYVAMTRAKDRLHLIRAATVLHPRPGAAG